ncbi:putative PAS/PAC sensor protein [Desulforamulus reducens MI-1]|uniref:Putative PAS/PAC sensor protein n=1 Tax=Desulforamulus reducens (strain ATCC BAA-1160 / DSM 100696 / MI-1) TaxID=349161 RepID=A4J240_DESRM|nr:putative PAS/PAC sensor protein [Desulforamulus reducens MI-1]
MKAYGYSLKELLTLSIYDLREPGTIGQVAIQMRQALEKGTLFDTIHRRKDRSVFPVEVSAKRILHDGNILILSSIRDISHRRKTELALRQSNEELTAANEELIASNEQILATEEELRQQFIELQKSKDQLATANRQLAEIIEFLPDATFIVNQEKK